jgi:hypothetical protein
MKSITYNREQSVGSYGCKYLEELDGIPRVKANGTMRIERYALFLCGSCNNTFRACIGKIKSNQQKACGCNWRTSEGLSTLANGKIFPLYDVWRGMIKRCQNENRIKYKNYGGRGILVCEEWQKSFRVFRGWAINNGYKKGLQIDRRDNNGNYEPKNCQFVTHAVNNSNKRNNVYCWLDGEKMIVAEAARKTGKDKTILYKWAQGKYPKKVPSNLVFEEPS